MLGNRPTQRFSLLLLDEGEYYFEDFSAFYYPAGDDDLAYKKRVKGRLQLCSGSLLFDPEDIKLPIIKLPFRHVEYIQQWKGNLTSKLAAKADLFVIRSNVSIEMKENNINAPYTFKEVLLIGSSLLTLQKEKKDHRFSLNYVSINSFIPRVQHLLEICKKDPEIADMELKAIIEDRESAISFNTSYIEDLNEKVELEITCIRVTPLVNNPGKLLVTNDYIYFQPFNNISINPVNKYKLESIVRMMKRSYVLRQVGMELFFDNDQSVFFAFKKPGMRDAVYDALIKQPVVLKNLAMDDQHNMTLKWQNRIISNYEYLMYLNNMAGRSFNDLTQYPVFPWVIADYVSEKLDLTDEKTFRDLSKPIGALNQDRLRLLKERMMQMPDNQPRFLYGTHYSTPGYVLFYLVRQAPEYMLRLQNGKFDAPSRMFHSIAETWAGVLNNQADVKELIPEFYQDTEAPNFLLNSERLNLGVKDNGVRIDDVVLPPWAENAQDFLKKCRQALESDYVSNNLHHWIDLIFGYKQKGEEAFKADNVFYHLTYEGAVDIDSIKDPMERNAIIAQIKEFGQTPKQLFTKPHPQRLAPGLTPSKVPSFATPTKAEPLDLTSLLAPLYYEWKNTDDLEENFSFKLHKDAITSFAMSADGNTLYSVSQDTSLKMYSLSEKKQLRSVNICELALSSCQLTPDEKAIVAGSWDNNVYMYSIESGRVLDTLAAHDDAVSCLGLKNDVVVTGSWDATVKAWGYGSTGLSKIPIADFTDYDTEVHSIDVAQQGNIAVSGSADGTIVFLDVRNKTTVRTMQPHTDAVTCIQFTPDGSRIVTCSADKYLKVLEVGGAEIFSTKLPTKIRCLRTNGEMLYIGGDDGILRIWDLKSGVEKKQLKGHGEPINCLICSRDGDTVVTGCGGTIRVYRPAKDKNHHRDEGAEVQDEY